MGERKLRPAKKREREDMVKLEEKELSVKKANPTKLSQAKIREETEKRAAAARKAAEKPTIDTHLTKPLQENVNRIVVDGEEARTVEEAIAVLSVSDDPSSLDKHPEKRMKAAYEEFEKIRLPQLKTENPSMRLSQLKQLLWKEWQKSPDNPLVRAAMSN